MKNTENSLKAKLQIGIVACILCITICFILLITSFISVPFYNITAEERELLARLVHSEASTCSQECRIAVASVIFNRWDAGKWGSSIYDVVYYPKAFSPVWYDKLYDWEPDQRDYDAVDYVVQNGPTLPTYVRYFRTDYDFQWDLYCNYIVIDNVYFGYFENWQQGAW